MSSRDQNSIPQNNTRVTKKSESKFWVTGGYFDYQALFILIVILSFGVLMVYSASSYRARVSGVSSSYFARKQAMFALAGLALLYVVSHIDYRKLKKYTGPFMVLSIVLVCSVFFIGKSTNGSTRWIYVGSIGFQPSEIAKFAIILYTAYVCSISQKLFSDYKNLGKKMLLPLLTFAIIAIENLSSALVCFVIIYAIFFVACPNRKLVYIIPFVIIPIGILFIALQSYRSTRLDAWLHPTTSEYGYQTMQSLYAIGSGGFFGRGLGQSIQKSGFLPESHNDMIFAVICEELGLFGAICVIALFFTFIMRLKYIADNTSNSFGGLIITGIIAHIAFQVIVNIGVVVNLVPNTGVTLPFVSYGGSSLVFLLIEVGVALGISRQIKPLERR